jgi:hypothetical protein
MRREGIAGNFSATDRNIKISGLDSLLTTGPVV